MIYIHIPFCKQACNYCDFHFATSKHYLEPTIESILKEIELRSTELDSELTSIYFGGGTPSQLKPHYVESIFNKISKFYSIATECEITLEANPDDLNKEYLNSINNIGINRLSIGTQSFRDEDLTFMNRAHSAQEAINCSKDAFESGIKNISIDLIYGIPGMSDEIWKQHLTIASELPINHLSCYALTVEKNTPLDKLIKKGISQKPDEDLVANQFKILQDFSLESGFDHYEISNLARAGKRAKHNSDYWKGKPYIGIGPSAHSFNGKQRRVNIANNQRYIQSIKTGDCEHEVEEIDQQSRYNELILTGFRTQNGIQISDLKNCGEYYYQYFNSIHKNHPNKSNILFEGNCIKLDKTLWIHADGVTADFFSI